MSGDIHKRGEEFFQRILDLPEGERQTFLEGVAQGLADVQAGRVISDKELRKQLDAEFGALEAE